MTWNNFFDIVTVDKVAHKAPDSTSLLHERMISNLQSGTLFPRKQSQSNDIYFNGEILYLRNQLNDCLHRLQIQRDNSDFVSYVDKLKLLQKPENISLNIPFRKLHLIKDYNELNKNVHYDIDKVKEICQKSSKCSDDKIIKNLVTDKDKTDLSNSNDINGNSNKHKGNKYDIRKKIYIFLLCDSMMKDAKGWELLSKIDHKHSIYVRRFSGAKVKSMKVYAKPCVTVESPDHIILQVGINELNSKNIPEKVAKSYLDLAKGMVS